MRYLTRDEARRFCDRWLPAWTGNDPQRLASFYSEDACYLDPGVTKGIKGKDALLTYFTKLLRQNPDWVWSHIEGIPMQDGFLNKWRATIPVGKQVLETTGVCLVQLDADDRIYRNEVYFDRSELLQAIQRDWRKNSQ